MEILATCDPCILKQGWGIDRADYHGVDQVGLEGEWVLTFRRDEITGEMTEKWVRIEGIEGWREWMRRRRVSENEF